MSTRGYFAVGIYHAKAEVNIGTLWRSAASFGAAFVFTVGRRYKTQSSDTCKTHRHAPLFHFDSVDDLVAHLPHGCPLVGVELHPDAEQLGRFWHPQRAAYLLGAEDHGLPASTLVRCHHTIEVPHAAHCLNVSVAGSIVMYDRVAQNASRRAIALAESASVTGGGG